MSLFQAREWWTHRLDADEEYDVGGLAVGNIDNDPSQSGTLIGPRTDCVRLQSFQDAGPRRLL